MEPFDLIILVVIGDFVQQGVTQQDLSVTGSILAIVTIGVLVVATSWLGFRFRRLRPVLEGRGRLRRRRSADRGQPRPRADHLEELAAQARLKEIDSIDKVRWAVLETSGAINWASRPAPLSADEDYGERLDRELIELMNGLGVILPGVQVLFAFLPTVPFTQRFDDITSQQRDVYFAAFVARRSRRSS